MGKKKDRRKEVEPSSSERRAKRRDIATVGDRQSVKFHAGRFSSAFLFIFTYVVFPAITIFFFRKLFYKSSPPSGPSSTQQQTHDVLTTDLTYHQLLSEHMGVSQDSSQRHFRNPVLAYITPWNSKGYDLAKKYNHKFTHLSPVWYELKSEGTKLKLEGRHNADGGWLSELRMKGDAKILPRVVLEANPVDLLRNKKQWEKAIDLIISECREMEYDGIVLESWSRWIAYGILHDPEMRNKGLKFVKRLGQALHSTTLPGNSEQSMELVYVIGPPRLDKVQEHDIGPADLQGLSDAVDGFSLMTYDFSGPHNPGPNAPLAWVQATLRYLAGGAGRRQIASKIYLGINFYGNDFVISGGLGGGPIVGGEYLSLLERHRPIIHWENSSAEHFFVYTDDQDAKHAVFYPTLQSLTLRLNEARLSGAGVSIWEIGQGLDYFFELL